MVSKELKKLLDCLNTVSNDGEDDCDCGHANINFECLAEMAVDGVDIHSILPDVATHIEHCADCREEYEALVSILVAERENRIP
jgi:hypothetical protein